MAKVNGSGCDHNTSTEEPPVYMAAHPKLTTQKSALKEIIKHGQPTTVESRGNKHTTWQQKISMYLVCILWKSFSALQLVGLIIEWTTNLLALNNGVLGLLSRIIFLNWGDIVYPVVGSENYFSILGLSDPRVDLLINASNTGKLGSAQAEVEVFPTEDAGSRSTADMCIMAAKLSYENPAVIKKVVEQNWNMHLHGFYNCWNEYQNMKNTQAYVVMDKPTDANAVVVAFRGTEAFNAYDWSTDFDFSFITLEGLGGVHLGFLEALGLATRDSIDTFVKMNKKAQSTKHQTKIKEQQEALANNLPPSPHHRTKSEIHATLPTSGLADTIIADSEKILAYDHITEQVALILHDNPNAKLYITGHSLGGALAVLYAAMLHYTGQTEVASKIKAVYTFGQPRVGDLNFATYFKQKLEGRYFRVVYCNDLVPRVPFDNKLFAFKHLGDCQYFNSCYDGMVVQEVPNPNFFSVRNLLTKHLNAAWELFHAMFIACPEYGNAFKENNLSILIRALGVIFPGVAAHWPINYVNAIRLGPIPLKRSLVGDVAHTDAEFYLMQDNLNCDVNSPVSSSVLPDRSRKSPLSKHL